MRVERVEDVAVFRRRAAPLLEADEVRHTVILGILRGIADGRYREPSLWLVEDGGRVQAAAVRTPPFNVALARPVSDAALAALVGRIRADDPGATGVNGALPEAERFAALWGGPARVRMRMRLHALSALQPVPQAPGAMRSATAPDEPLLLEWMREFAAETGIQGSAEQHAAAVRVRRGDPLGIVVWEDGGRPVCFAGSGASSPGVVRVGPVYTPPAERGRGYATSLVASLTQALVDAGARGCLLYTDLANPTSNAIYARIGYRPVLDAVEISF